MFVQHCKSNAVLSMTFFNQRFAHSPHGSARDPKKQKNKKMGLLDLVTSRVVENKL
jgi:hypothetical protein